MQEHKLSERRERRPRHRKDRPESRRRVRLAGAVAAMITLAALAAASVSFRPTAGSYDAVQATAADPFIDDEVLNEYTEPAQLEAVPVGAGEVAKPVKMVLTGAPVIKTLGESGIPEVAVRAYKQAAARLAAKDPGCGIPWTLLAAIGRVESNHGRFGGAQLRSDGSATKRIRGIPLDGRPNVALIRDTDGGALDGDTVYDRAVGPMQFIPSTWRSIQADANGDGFADPNNIFDAAQGAAQYLCAAASNLRDPSQAAQAVRRYNNADSYVRVVLGLAGTYAAGRVIELPSTGNGLPNEPLNPQAVAQRPTGQSPAGQWPTDSAWVQPWPTDDSSDGTDLAEPPPARRTEPIPPRTTAAPTHPRTTAPTSRPRTAIPPVSRPTPVKPRPAVTQPAPTAQPSTAQPPAEQPRPTTKPTPTAPTQTSRPEPTRPSATVPTAKPTKPTEPTPTQPSAPKPTRSQLPKPSEPEPTHSTAPKPSEHEPTTAPKPSEPPQYEPKPSEPKPSEPKQSESGSHTTAPSAEPTPHRPTTAAVGWAPAMRQVVGQTLTKSACQQPAKHQSSKHTKPCLGDSKKPSPAEDHNNREHCTPQNACETLGSPRPSTKSGK